MKNDNRRGQRSSRYDMLERVFRLLEYLRVNTDRAHCVSQAELRRSAEIADFVPSKDTFNKTMRELADILNSGEGGVRPEEDWRLVYKNFAEVYGNDAGDFGEEEADKKLRSVTGIYYSHIFSDDELAAIINSLRTSKFVTEQEAEKIIGRLKRGIASKHYREPSYTVNAHEPTDTPELAQNLVTIQRAIGRGNKITFSFRYYNEFGSLEPNKSERHTVSPYHITMRGGAYYLLGGFESGKMCVYRIDLMDDIRLSKKDGKLVKSLPANKIHGLPRDAAELERFKETHPYMSYETELIKVKLKALKAPRTNRGNRLTHLNGVFGNNYKYLGNGYYEVECTEYDILTFAVRECDDFKVVEPKTIIEKIKDKIREIGKLYGV